MQKQSVVIGVIVLLFFHIIIYIDIESNSEERELLDCIMTEFACGFPEIQNYKEELVFSKEPFENLNKLKSVIFWRNELPVFNRK